MVISIFGKLKGTIKNANDLLGFLIYHMDKKQDVRAGFILENANMDNVSLTFLLKELEEKHYIICSLDTAHVTDLGKFNYRSPYKRFVRFLFFAFKEIFFFIAGVLSGILVSFFSLLLTRVL